MKKQMHLLYVHHTALGYARTGVKMAETLSNLGVDVDDHLHSRSNINDLALDDDRPIKHLACWISTPSHARGWFKGQHTVLLSMWEAMNLPESFREGMHNFDQIVVPSDQNLELFSRYHDNVVKVPLGIDTQEWRYRKRQAPKDTFRFLIGGSGKRKGVDLAFKAFTKVFQTWPKDGPIPILQMKSPMPVTDYAPRVETITGRIPDADEQALYANAHCYIQPSRGEGWGLQPLQAIASGCPTILTDAHGHADFSYLGYPLSAKPSPADYFMYGDAGDWWEPNFDELCDTMLWVYNNYSQAEEFAKLSSSEALARFSWKQSAEKFIAAVGEEHFLTEYSGDGSWVEPEYKLYPVVTKMDWPCMVAGYHYDFRAGEEQWVVADVKRLLHEAGVLDLSCVVRGAVGDVTPEESGLTSKQLLTLDKRVARDSYCHTCGQMLNSGTLWEPDDHTG